VTTDQVAELVTAYRHTEAMIRQLERRIKRAEQADVEHHDDRSRQALAQLDREHEIALEQRLDLFAELATHGVSPYQPSDRPATPTPRLDAAMRALRKIQEQPPT
jgi:predicted  nucleic acid-binding Zn-ribbon protein